MRPSPTAGQASLEYVAVISLVTAVLVFAAPAVGAPAIAAGVARALRTGICVLGADVCTQGDAAAAGLPPCQLHSATRGAEASATFFSIEVGGRSELTGYRSSDGSITMVWTAGGSAGASSGVGFAWSGAGRGLDGALRAKMSASRAWRFPDEETARRFVAGMPGSAVDSAHWPPAWHTLEGGAQAAAGLEQELPGLDLATVGVTSDDAFGARVSRGGATTFYFNVSFDGPEATIPFFPSVGHGKTSVVAEFTVDRDGPRELAFRRVEPSERNTRLTETVTRLDLRDPAAVPRVDWLLHPRGALEQMGRVGTVERNVYTLSDDSRGVSGSLAFGIKFGASVKYVDIERELVEAGVRIHGSQERSRFDCLDQRR